jgi:hypothetical protein
MAHFAKLDENNTVLAVHVVVNDVITVNGNESEQAGIDFLTSLYGHNLWKQTSYNGKFRKNYAAVDYTYDVSRDAFIPPKPYASWLLNETTCQWEPPIPYPVVNKYDNKFHTWNEATLSWDEVVNGNS